MVSSLMDGVLARLSHRDGGMLRFGISIVQIVIARPAQQAEAISCRVAEIASRSLSQ
jgi:hypothetical protein